MPDIFPASHSILSANALMTEVLRDYDVGTPTECKLLNRGLNDTYVVVTERGKFALRIYRKVWRSESEVLFELDALLHLAGKGAPVSAPIPRKDGRIAGMVTARRARGTLCSFHTQRGESQATKEKGRRKPMGMEKLQRRYTQQAIPSKVPTAALPSISNIC